jgi:hypothetical protein
MLASASSLPTCPAASALGKKQDTARAVSTTEARIFGSAAPKQDIRKAQKALGYKRIDTTAQQYVLDELEEGLTDDLY